MNETKIANSFKKVREDIFILKEALELSLNETKELRGQLREALREVTTRSTTRTSEVAPIKAMQKRTLERLDKAQILKAIKHYLDEGYRTNQIRDEIMNRFNIKTTCFFKYLKELREALREVTTRSTTRS